MPPPMMPTLLQPAEPAVTVILDNMSQTRDEDEYGAR